MLQHNYTMQDMKFLFETMKKFTKPGEAKGITRLAYSKEDEEAHKYFIEMLKDHGLTVRQDAMGNIFARLKGKDSSLPAVGTGSHLDTVPEGGAYDGTLGVVTGFYALMQFRPGELLRDLELVVFRAEESSRFGFSCIGSKTITGNANMSKWKENKDDDGQNIFDVLNDNGYNAGELEDCVLPDHYYSAFLELHIEQGKSLENNGTSVGVVKGIAAPTRFAVEVKGHADHSGATPMNQRQDALVASAVIIEDINHVGCKESSWGTVATVGKIEVHPNSMNVIPGEVIFYVDIRGIESKSISRVAERLKQAVNKAETDHDVTIALREISSETPVKMDDNVCSILAAQCEKNKVSYQRMLSGAGHDTMYMAQKFPAAMLFTPSVNGVSHHPDEFTHFSDIEVSANILKETLKEICNHQ